MLTINRILLACLVLTLVVRADAPFYTSKKLGLLVRQPPGWKVVDQESLIVAEPGGTARARFELVSGQDATQAWKQAVERLKKAHPDFAVVEELVNTPRACLIQARFQEGGAEWVGTYLVKPFGPKLLISASESRQGADSKLTNWLGAVLESATPVR